MLYGQIKTTLRRISQYAYIEKGRYRGRVVMKREREREREREKETYTHRYR